MKKFNKEVESIKELVEKIENKDMVILKIRDIISALASKTDWTGDWLTKTAQNLAVLGYRLSQMTSDATMESELAYGYRKFRYAFEWSRKKELIKRSALKVTNAEIDQQIEVKNWRDYRRQIRKKYYADRLLNLSVSLGRLLNVIELRVNELARERKGSEAKVWNKK